MWPADKNNYCNAMVEKSINSRPHKYILAVQNKSLPSAQESVSRQVFTYLASLSPSLVIRLAS